MAHRTAQPAAGGDGSQPPAKKQRVAEPADAKSAGSGSAGGAGPEAAAAGPSAAAGALSKEECHGLMTPVRGCMYDTVPGRNLLLMLKSCEQHRGISAEE